MLQEKKTLVIGASENSSRYSNLAIKKLLSHQHEVVAIGSKTGKVDSVIIEKEHLPFENIHTVTLYLNPTNQRPYYDYIISLKPKRVIFNPGTENTDFEDKLKSAGIETMEACTLVLLSTGQY